MRTFYETHFQPQQFAPQPGPRFQGSHGDAERPQCIGPAPRQGTQTTDPVAPAKPRARFEFHKRLTQPAEFKAARLNGRRFGDSYFSLFVVSNQSAYPRLGLAIATKVCGSAVERNRIKRMIRESFRLNQSSLPPVNITVSARVAAKAAPSAVLRASLQGFWKSIAARRFAH